MRNYILPFIVLFTTSTFAQNIQVEEATASIDGQSRNSLTVIITEGNAGDVNKAWKKELKGMKGKVSDKKFLFADDCEVKSMGDNSFDVYAVTESVAGGAKLIIAFDLGGAYLNSREHPDRFSAAKSIVYKFAVEQTKAVVSAQLKNQEKVLGQMEKDLASMKKDKEKLEADIEDYKKKIVEAQESIKTNIGQQAAKKTEMEGQKATIGTLSTKLGAIK